jgi:hypothetical protein
MTTFNLQNILQSFLLKQAQKTHEKISKFQTFQKDKIAGLN